LNAGGARSLDAPGSARRKCGMNPKLAVLAFSLSLAAPLAAQTGQALPLANGGFEEELKGWSANADGGMSIASAAAARTGKLGLRVTDGKDSAGSSLGSNRLPAVVGKTYEVRFQGRVVAGAGIGVYLRFFDAKGAVLNTQEKKNQNLVALGRTHTDWQAHSVKGTAPEGATQVEVWIHSYNKNTVTADFDDVALFEL